MATLFTIFIKYFEVTFYSILNVDDWVMEWCEEQLFSSGQWSQKESPSSLSNHQALFPPTTAWRSDTTRYDWKGHILHFQTLVIKCSIKCDLSRIFNLGCRSSNEESRKYLKAQVSANLTLWWTCWCMVIGIDSWIKQWTWFVESCSSQQLWIIYNWIK